MALVVTAIVTSMIAGPANYSNTDLWRMGAPLGLIYTVIVVAMVIIKPF